MNIYLIGLPGSGKSTLGKELAKFLNYQFIDTDAELEKHENNTIEAIFNNHEEDYFRKVEQTILHLVSKKNNQVISTGGGLPCFFDNMNFLNKNGVSVYIDVPIESLVVRITKTNINVRPMVKNKSEEEVYEFLKTKKTERELFYNLAKLKFSGANIKSNDIIEGLKNKNLL